MFANRGLAEDCGGSAADKFALFCALVSIACVIGAHGLDKLAQLGGLPVFGSDRLGRTAAIDYAPTGSIAGRAAASQLNPCGDNAQNR